MAGSTTLCIPHCTLPAHPQAAFFKAAGVRQLGGTLLGLPFIHAPSLSLALRLGWRLPGGRPAARHHLFPPQPATDGSRQAPTVVSVGSGGAAPTRRSTLRRARSQKVPPTPRPRKGFLTPAATLIFTLAAGRPLQGRST